MNLAANLKELEEKRLAKLKKIYRWHIGIICFEILFGLLTIGLSRVGIDISEVTVPVFWLGVPIVFGLWLTYTIETRKTGG